MGHTDRFALRSSKVLIRENGRTSAFAPAIVVVNRLRGAIEVVAREGTSEERQIWHQRDAGEIQVFELHEHMIIPGVIDVGSHHLNIGHEAKLDDVEAGTLAAASGGVTTLVEAGTSALPPPLAVRSVFKRVQQIRSAPLYVNVGTLARIESQENIDPKFLHKIMCTGAMGIVSTLSGLSRTTKRGSGQPMSSPVPVSAMSPQRSSPRTASSLEASPVQQKIGVLLGTLNAERGCLLVEVSKVSRAIENTPLIEAMKVADSRKFYSLEDKENICYSTTTNENSELDYDLEVATVMERPRRLSKPTEYELYKNISDELIVLRHRHFMHSLKGVLYERANRADESSTTDGSPNDSQSSPFSSPPGPSLRNSNQDRNGGSVPSTPRTPLRRRTSQENRSRSLRSNDSAKARPRRQSVTSACSAASSVRSMLRLRRGSSSSMKSWRLDRDELISETGSTCPSSPDYGACQPPGIPTSPYIPNRRKAQSLDTTSGQPFHLNDGLSDEEVLGAGLFDEYGGENLSSAKRLARTPNKLSFSPSGVNGSVNTLQSPPQFSISSETQSAFLSPARQVSSRPLEDSSSSTNLPPRHVGRKSIRGAPKPGTVTPPLQLFRPTGAPPLFGSSANRARLPVKSVGPLKSSDLATRSLLSLLKNFNAYSGPCCEIRLVGGTGLDELLQQPSQLVQQALENAENRDVPRHVSFSVRQPTPIQAILPTAWEFCCETNRSFEAMLEDLTYESARFLGLAGRKGLIAAGMDADLVILDGETKHVRTTFCAGQVVFDAEWEATGPPPHVNKPGLLLP